MLERRSGLDRRQRRQSLAYVGEIERALETVRFLRPEILKYVRTYGPSAAAYFDTVIDAWYGGTLADRIAFVKSCSGNKAMADAWSIVHSAGALAAPLVPYVVRRYYGQRFPGERE